MNSSLELIMLQERVSDMTQVAEQRRRARAAADATAISTQATAGTPELDASS